MLQIPETPPASCSFVSQRLRMHYVDWGNHDAPLLILVHGGQDHARNWDWLAGELRRDWHVVAPDLRGHGESEWSPDGDYGHAAYVYDLAQLIRVCGDERPVSIVGHSLGGVISCRFAGAFPERVRRLVSIEGISMMPWVDAGDEVPPLAQRLRGWVEDRQDFAAREPRRFDTFAQTCERMKANNAALSDEQAHHLALYGTRRNEDGTFSWRFDDYTRKATMIDITRAEERGLYGEITCPVLLLQGGASWFNDPREDGREGFFREVRTVSFEGAGHWIHHDRPEAVLAELQDFL